MSLGIAYPLGDQQVENIPESLDSELIRCMTRHNSTKFGHVIFSIINTVPTFVQSDKSNWFTIKIHAYIYE